MPTGRSVAAVPVPRHGFPHPPSRVPAIPLIEVQVNSGRLKVLYRFEKVAERAAPAVKGPGHYNVELAAACILQHLVEAGTLVAPFGTADGVVDIDFDDFPTAPFCDFLQRDGPVLRGLPIGPHSTVNRGAPILKSDYSISGSDKCICCNRCSRRMV
jgi:hypothetical protein